MTDPAKGRFVIMQLTRLVGVFMVLVGVLLQDHRIAALKDVPAAAGYVLIVVGMIDVFVMPLVLARKWRTPPE